MMDKLVFMTGKNLQFFLSYPNQDLDKRLFCFDINDFKNDDYFILKDNQKIIALAAIKINPKNPKILWMQYISVDPEYQNQKCATKLVREIFKYASKNNLNIQISTYTQNGKLYLKHIFQKYEKKYPNIKTIHLN